MVDHCSSCKPEKVNFESVPYCIVNTIKNVIKETRECKCAKDYHNILKKDDNIVYLAIYLIICWLCLLSLQNINRYGS